MQDVAHDSRGGAQSETETDGLVEEIPAYHDGFGGECGEDTGKHVELFLFDKFFEQFGDKISEDSHGGFDDEGGGRINRAVEREVRQSAAQACGNGAVSGTEEPAREENERISEVEISSRGLGNFYDDGRDETKRRKYARKGDVFCYAARPFFLFGGGPLFRAVIFQSSFFAFISEMFICDTLYSECENLSNKGTKSAKKK